MARKQRDYRVMRYPGMRRLIVDGGRLARRQHTVLGLVEIDVTEPRQLMREHRARTGEALSFTAFMIACLAQAIDMDKYMHAYRAWFNRLILFDEVDVLTLVDSDSPDRQMPIPHIIRAANKRTFRDIHEEIRAIQSQPSGAAGGQRFNSLRWFLMLPAFIKDVIYEIVRRSPHAIKKHGGMVLLTSVGMFGPGISGWAVAPPNHTLTALIGGIAEKPGVVEGQIAVREYLNVTFSFNHDVIDGVPAARFVERLKGLIEGCYGLDGEATHSERLASHTSPSARMEAY